MPPLRRPPVAQNPTPRERFKRHLQETQRPDHMVYVILLGCSLSIVIGVILGGGNGP